MNRKEKKHFISQKLTEMGIKVSYIALHSKKHENHVFVGIDDDDGNSKKILKSIPDSIRGEHFHVMRQCFEDSNGDLNGMAFRAYHIPEKFFFN